MVKYGNLNAGNYSSSVNTKFSFVSLRKEISSISPWPHTLGIQAKRSACHCLRFLLPGAHCGPFPLSSLIRGIEGEVHFLENQKE